MEPPKEAPTPDPRAHPKNKGTPETVSLFAQKPKVFGLDPSPISRFSKKNVNLPRRGKFCPKNPKKDRGPEDPGKTRKTPLRPSHFSKKNVIFENRRFSKISTPKGSKKSRRETAFFDREIKTLDRSRFFSYSARRAEKDLKNDPYRAIKPLRRNFPKS